jgi:hypothetical protein
MLDRSAVEANIPAADHQPSASVLRREARHEARCRVRRGGSAVQDLQWTFFNIYQTQYAGQAGHTIAQWHVDDVDQEVRDLIGKGVAFEVYDMPGVEWNGHVATLPGMGKAAWFKDSEGNIMCVDEGAPSS